VEAKAKMLSMIPDDLKRLVGSQTAKKGMLRVLDMFQYTDLNKRLVYLTLEAFLCKVT
jgi:sorting nexin-13